MHDLDDMFERYEEAFFNFHRYDTDGSGTIDATELVKLLTDMNLHAGRKGLSEERLQKWADGELKRSDKNGDGVLSFEEFLAYYNSFIARHRKPIEDLYDLSDTVLGKGAFGTVVLAIRTGHTRAGMIETGATVAVKKLDKAHLGESSVLHNEIAVWESLDHPHLVKLIDVFDTPSDIVLITELMSGGDLFERMRAVPSGRFEPPVAARLGAQLVAAVNYLHANGVVHCDLKPSNILAVEDAKCGLAELTIKVADFGLSQQIEKAKLANNRDDGGGEEEVGGGGELSPSSPQVAEVGRQSSFDAILADTRRESQEQVAGDPESAPIGLLDVVCGTPDYFAPELVALANESFGARSYDVGVDNWAVGCILWEFLRGAPPFVADSEAVLFHLIEFEEPTPPAGDAPPLPPEAADLMRRLLEKDATQRLTSAEALAHPWLAGDAQQLGLAGA